MGRHTADDGAAVDPIVAAALSRRPTPTEPGTPRHDPESRQRLLTGAVGDGGLGWPGEPGDGTGLGWPVDDNDQRESATPASLAPEPARRRGWRRLFGSAA